MTLRLNDKILNEIPNHEIPNKQIDDMYKKPDIGLTAMTRI